MYDIKTFSCIFPLIYIYIYIYNIYIIYIYYYIYILYIYVYIYIYISGKIQVNVLKSYIFCLQQIILIVAICIINNSRNFRWTLFLTHVIYLNRLFFLFYLFNLVKGIRATIKS